MTPFGKAVRKLRIDADITLSDMAKALRKTPSYLSAVELGDKSLNDELVRATIGYLKSLPYFRQHPLDEAALYQFADSRKRSLNMEALEDREREAVAAFARRLPTLSDTQRAAVTKKLADWMEKVE